MRPTAVALVLLLSGSTGVAAQSEGEAVFAGACTGCHAAGSPRVLAGQPLLPGTRAVRAAEPAGAIRIVLHGHHPPPYRRGPWMPAFAPILSDAQVAAVLDWLRAASGQPAWQGLADQVRQLRMEPMR